MKVLRERNSGAASSYRVTFQTFSFMSQPPWPLTKNSSASKIASHSGPDLSRASGNFPWRSNATDAGASTSAGADSIPIICFSHLSWDWVWQRPQQYLSRFAQNHRVLFVELYCSEVTASRAELRPADGHPNVTIAQLHLPASRWSEAPFIDAERRRVLKELLRRELAGQFTRPLLWFYDPMAVTAYAGQLNERAIVYDCMDELSQFRGAPPKLVERERELLRVADVVFCGGQKMRRKRLPLNANTHFFGTGVDVDHFGRALSPELALAPEMAALGGAPVLGYFGVVDERIDYDLVAALADARRDWHVVMVGPTAKVNPADFPQRPNLHWLGARPYAQLPALTKGFSVALMPFALNAATEYINPTKALENMAAGRPVVSTALDEVKMNFGKVARVAQSAADFVAYCAEEVEKPSAARIARGRKLAAENTWEANVARMERHIEAVLRAKPIRDRSSETLTETAALTKFAYV